MTPQQLCKLNRSLRKLSAAFGASSNSMNQAMANMRAVMEATHE